MRRDIRSNGLDTSFIWDTADGGVPISCVITSASLHDSQAAIPLAKSTKQRVENCYDLMDGAYDAKEIDAYVRELGRVPIIDRNPRSKKAEARRELKAQRHARFTPPERIRYRERSTVERAFGRLKDEYGARHIRVRGHKKVMCPSDVRCGRPYRGPDDPAGSINRTIRCQRTEFGGLEPRRP